MPGDLGLTLSNALSGLRINQQQLSVLSQNISNANTQGYSRQTLTQTAVSLAGVGEGVNAGEITRTVDQYLTQAVRSQNSSVGSANVLNDYYTRIQLLLGTPGGNNSIDSYYNGFFNSVQSLAQSPGNVTLQQAAVNSGVTLATQTQDLANGLQNLQYQADQDIKTSISKINTDLVNLSQINVTISNNAALGKGTADLQDQRDALLQDMSQYIDVKTFLRSDGSVNVTSGGGISILDNNLYQLAYTPVGNASAFSNGTILAPVTVTPVDSNLNPIGTSINMVSSGTPANITSLFSSGKIAGLISLRDQLIPNIMSQLDSLTGTMTDQFNAIHNTGSSFPGVNSLTGETAVTSQQATAWSGQARIAVLDQNGQPLASPYPDEANGIQPLTLDLSHFNTGSGAGKPSVQGIIDSINQYYGVPQNKVELSNLNNIQMVSANQSLPSNPPNFNFGFDLNNLSANPANFYVTGVHVTNDSGTDITSVTSTVPSVALDPNTTYTMTPSPGPYSDVVIKTANANTLTNGQVIYLSTPPAGTYNNISAANLGGYFTVSNVTSNSFQVSVIGAATSGPAVGIASMTATPPYTTAAAGQNTLTTGNGLFTANLSSPAATNALSYNISVDVGVDDGSGNVKTSTITYRVNNNQPNVQGLHLGAQVATGNGLIVTPTNKSKPIAVATLVDANGKELPKTNGAYNSSVQGYLKIQAGNSANMIAIDSLNSQELGLPNNTPPIPATNRGFSYYFGLNNFFSSNPPNTNGSSIPNSALNMKVEQRFLDNPGSISLGQLSKGADSGVSGAPPNYTYQLNPGDNSVIQKLAALASNNSNFVATGGLGANVQTLSGYAGEIIGTASTNSATAKTNGTTAQSLLDGLSKQSSNISGVNLDSELANTVVYQNAYSASARVITVVSGLFDTLLQSIQ